MFVGLYFKKIKLLPNNKYEIVQILVGHTFVIDKALELEDGKLLTCSDDKTIIVWKKNINNDLYELEKKIVCAKERYPNVNIVLINENILLSTSKSDLQLRFYEIKDDFQLIFTFDNIDCCFSRNSILYIEEKDLLFVGGGNNNGIYLFKLKKIPIFINKFYTDWIDEVFSIILLGNGDILMGVHEKEENKNEDEQIAFSICKFRINEKNEGFTFIKKYEKAHGDLINGLIEWKEKNLIVSCSKDEKIKLWNINDE